MELQPFLSSTAPRSPGEGGVATSPPLPPRPPCHLGPDATLPPDAMMTTSMTETTALTNNTDSSGLHIYDNVVHVMGESFAAGNQKPAEEEEGQ